MEERSDLSGDTVIGVATEIIDSRVRLRVLDLVIKKKKKQGKER